MSVHFKLANVQCFNIPGLTDNLLEIQELLKKIAESDIPNNHNVGVLNNRRKCNFNMKELATPVLSFDYFSAFNTDFVFKKIEDFQHIIDEFLDSSVDGSGIVSSYNVLAAIFELSTENFRQKHFHQLIDLHYQHLCKDLNKQAPERLKYDQAIKLFLPVVKLDLASRWIQDDICGNEARLEELLLNIRNFLKYPGLNQEDIYEIMSRQIHSSTCTLNSFQLIPLDEANGFLGEYFKLEIVAKSKENIEQYDLFVKLLTPKTRVLKELALTGASKKEDFFYTVYLPLLEKYNISINFAPRCHFSRLNDVLVLDNLASMGFTALLPNSHLEYPALQKVVEQIATFHASTMILEEILSQKNCKNVTVYDIFPEYLQEVFFVPKDDYIMKPSFDAARGAMHHLSKKFPDITKHISEDDLTKLVDEAWRSHFEKVKASATLKNTMCHGDMHVANTLYKFENDICLDVKLIDFQILRYCPPTHDLLFFLWQVCTREFRKKHLIEICEHYYQELSKHLKQFGFDIDKVYPKDDFQKSLKHMKSQAITQALYYSPVIKIPASLKKEVFSTKEKANYYMYQYRWKLVDLGLEEEEYRTELRGLLEDLVELYESGDL